MESGGAGPQGRRGPSTGWPAVSYGRSDESGDRTRPPARRTGRPGGSPTRGSGWLRLVVLALAVVVAFGALVIACGIRPGQTPPPASGSPGSPSPAGSGGLASASPAGSASLSPSSSAGASPSATASTAPSASPPQGTVPLAVVSAFDNYKVTSITRKALATRLGAGTLVVPCGAEAAVARALGATGKGAAACVAADRITAYLDPASKQLALVPPALVTPRVKVVPLDGADLFGEKPARTRPTRWSSRACRRGRRRGPWTASDVRVVVTTGVNCADRGVSHQTVVLKKGWDWLLKAGTARYTGTHWDSRYGWTVVDAVRTGHAGAVWNLIKDADVAVSDFECPMTRNFTQHDQGTIFSVDPRMAALMAKAGFDVATIATDHMTNAGVGAVGETVDFFEASGIQSTGGGRTLAEALRPAIVKSHGLTFAFLGFDAIGGSAYATKSSAGVARLTAANVKAAVAKARAAGAQVIIALPQWSAVEYRAGFTAAQLALAKLLVDAGVDHVVGADFHWAGAISITRTGSAYRYVGASQGNFWFGQDWSRQTQEGVITSLTFAGTRLVQVRLTPTVMLNNAQANLIDPATDGQFVLKQVLKVSTLASK